MEIEFRDLLNGNYSVFEDRGDVAVFTLLKVLSAALGPFQRGLEFRPRPLEWI